MFVPLPPRDAFLENDAAMERQQWLDDHGGEWDCQRIGWNFLDDKEAVLFKLRWCDL